MTLNFVMGLVEQRTTQTSVSSLHCLMSQVLNGALCHAWQWLPARLL